MQIRWLAQWIQVAVSTSDRTWGRAQETWRATLRNSCRSALPLRDACRMTRRSLT